MVHAALKGPDRKGLVAFTKVSKGVARVQSAC